MSTIVQLRSAQNGYRIINQATGDDLEVLAAVAAGNMLVVSKDGSDSTGSREDVSLPFLTLAAAKAAATSGDLILVYPGTYNERNLLKNGVNWHFLPGANITYTGSVDGAIWDNSSSGTTGAITSRITGKAKFTHNGSQATPTRCYTVIVNNTSSDIDIECELISNAMAGAGEQGAVRHAGGTLTIRAAKVVSMDGLTVWWSNGDLRLYVDDLEITTASMAVGPSELYCGALVATPGKLDSGFTGTIPNTYTSGNVWLNVSRAITVGASAIGMGLYWWGADGDTTRLWCRVHEIVLGDQSVSLYFYSGRIYLHCDKINGDAQTTAAQQAFLSSCNLWANIQKWTGAGVLVSLFDAAKVYLDILHIEDTGNKLTKLFDINGAGVIARIRLLSGVGGTGADGIVNTNGTLFFEGLLDTSAASAKNPITLSDTQTTTLINATIRAHASKETVYASSAQAMTISGIASINTAVHANVTANGLMNLNGKITSPTLVDGANIVLGTTTGTKIGTATSQKLGFYNSTPVIQPTSTTDLRAALIALGLYATGGASPLDLNGGALTTGTVTVTDTSNIVLSTGTGTKLGTATGQKLGFWNATPIIQPAAAAQAALTDSTGGTANGTLVDVTTTAVADPAKINDNFADVVALVNALRTALVNAGIIKGSA